MNNIIPLPEGPYGILGDSSGPIDNIFQPTVRDRYPYVHKARACADPKSFVRGGPTLTTFF